MRARFLSRFLTNAALLLSCCMAGVALACTLNIREAGFLNNMGGPYAPQPYSLVLVTAKDGPEVAALQQRLLAITTNDQREINLTITVLGADTLPETDRAQMLADGIALTNLPASFLIRQDKGVNYVVSSFPRLLNEDDVLSLAMSPGKLRLQKLLSDNDNYAVLLLLPGANQAANAMARKELAASIKENADRFPTQRLPLAEVDRSAPRERLFLEELGVTSGDADPFCAIVFGKGRIVTPCLRGADITAEALSRMLTFLRANASDCTPDAVYLPGSVIDMIMPWSQRMDEDIYNAIAKSGVVPDLVLNEATEVPQIKPIAPPAPRQPAQPALPPVSPPPPAWLFPTLSVCGAIIIICLIATGLILRGKG